MGTETNPKLPSSQPQGSFKPGQDGWERRDVSVAWIFGITLFLAISGLVMHFSVGGVLGWFEKQPTPTDAWRPARASQAVSAKGTFPRLQVSAPADLNQFRRREDAELNTYGWINRTSGIVRLPIERAMDLLLQRGLPTRSGTNEAQGGPSSYDLIRQRSAPQTEGGSNP